MQFSGIRDIHNAVCPGSVAEGEGRENREVHLQLPWCFGSWNELGEPLEGDSVTFSPGVIQPVSLLWEVLGFTSSFLNGQLFLVFIFVLLHVINNGPNGCLSIIHLIYMELHL